jgi:general transcription factor 3C polypeptide 5 (transcription factor C subunit 1)
VTTPGIPVKERVIRDATRSTVSLLSATTHTPNEHMQNAEAGPSNTSATQVNVNRTATSGESAPLRPLPTTQFYSIEYPGYVKATSVPLALERLGGQASVDAAFKRGSGKNECALELNMRPGNPFSHPIPGEVLPSSNILMKVVKRRRKKRLLNGDEELVGEYTIEAVGVIPKTARFRSELAES